MVKSDANDWSGRMQMDGQVCAIAHPDQGDHLTLADMKVQPLDGLNGAIGNLEIVYLKDIFHAQATVSVSK